MLGDDWLQTYGWLYLAVVIAIGILAYFGVFNFSNVYIEDKCINEKFCEGYFGNFSGISSVENNIYCKVRTIKGDYFILKFIDVNYTELKNRYPECKT